jgi:hypothetical protein
MSQLEAEIRKLLKDLKATGDIESTVTVLMLIIAIERLEAQKGQMAIDYDNFKRIYGGQK